MRRLLCSLVAAVALAFLATPAQAQNSHPTSPRADDKIDRTNYHWELLFRQSEKFPLTEMQHQRNDRDLEQRAYYDWAKHWRPVWVADPLWPYTGPTPGSSTGTSTLPHLRRHTDPALQSINRSGLPATIQNQK